MPQWINVTMQWLNVGTRFGEAWHERSKGPLVFHTHGAPALLKTSEAEQDISTPAPGTLEILHDASPSPPFGVF